MEKVGAVLSRMPEVQKDRQVFELSSKRPKLSEDLFSTGLEILLEQAPKLEISTQKAKLMYSLLNDLTQEEFVRGIRWICQTLHEVYPNTNLTAYIRKFALEDLDRPTAGEAWQMVLNEMCRVSGIYGVPKIKDALVQKAVESVGWRDICNSEKPDVVRAHFTKAYESLLERRDRVAMVGE